MKKKNVIKEYFYACLEFDDGEIIRVLFTDRDEARDYITKHHYDEGVKSSWTE